MEKVDKEISRVAEIDFDVLLVGESGVGKDRVAFEIHNRSARKGNVFTTIPLRNLNESLIESELFGHEKGAFSGADQARVGLIEATSGGTVYIPEISSLTTSVQLKLLHFMQYKTISRVGQDARKPPIKVDVKIIMATNENLVQAVQKSGLREDFFYRITGISIKIPPLRERKEDIEILVNHFLRLYEKRMNRGHFSATPALLKKLEAYNWPGNVRELENAIKHALVNASGNQLLPGDFNRDSDEWANTSFQAHPVVHDQELVKYKIAEQQFRRIYFENLLISAKGNVSLAAKLSGLSRQNIHKILLDMNLRQP
jgi:DNA-binding NtrC family response regulator